MKSAGRADAASAVLVPMPSSQTAFRYRYLPTVSRSTMPDMYTSGQCSIIIREWSFRTTEVSMSSKTHTERALITLRQGIVSGALAGGQRLYEVAVAKELDISRTPVRAALSKLAEEGLLDRLKAGGFAVRRFDLSDVKDTIELRGVLEGTAARFAAERGASVEDKAQTRVCVRNLDEVLSCQDVDMSSYSKWNSAFHACLGRMSGSRVLMRELERVTALPFASPSAFLDDESQMAKMRQDLLVANEQHRGILEAIELRQGSRAEALTREHARNALRNVEFLSTDAAALREGSEPLAIVAQ
jgi:GntR family transcriptional regulator of vanillate catabolism